MKPWGRDLVYRGEYHYMIRLFIFLSLFLFNQIITWAQEKEIDELIQPYTQTNNFSGSVLISQNGEVIFSKAYGLMNRSYHVQNTTSTKFYLASVSMIFTAAAIMKLVDDHMVSIDDPLSKYLSDYKYGDSITLHHLLSQSSGIPPIGQNRKVDYDSISKFGHTIEQLIDYFKNDSLLFQPGTKYNHGRSDYIVLAYIIEKVTGKPFGIYLKESIFDPLQMNNTGHIGGENNIVENLASGYSPTGHYDVENAYHIDWTSKTGHGSIYATAEDLNRFANAILNNQILSEQLWQRIFTDYGDQVGYGWFIRRHLDKKRFQMNGRSPGFSSYFGIYPDDKLVVIVLSNNYISLPPDLGQQMAALVNKMPYMKTNLSASKLDSTQAHRLTGIYRFDEKFYVPNTELEVTLEEGLLSSTWGALIPVEDDKPHFNKFILRNYWSEVEFFKNNNGQVEAMIYDGFRGIKIK